MVNLGSLYWSVQVKGAKKAAKRGAAVEKEFGKTADKAAKAQKQTKKLEKSTKKYGKTAKKTRGRTNKWRSAVALLSTEFFFLGKSITNLLGITAVLTQIWVLLSGAATTVYVWLLTIGKYLPGLGSVIGGITDAISGFAAWLAAGSAGALAVAAAIGVVLGVIGVAILQWSGLLDVVRNFGKFLGNTLPGWVKDAMLVVISLFTGPLAVIGAAIAGFVKGYMKGGLQQGIATAVSNAQKVLAIFSGAWHRTLGRVWGFVQNFLGQVGKVPGRIEGFFGGLGGALGKQLKAAFNSIIPRRLDLPSVHLGGGSWMGHQIPSITVGGGSLNLPHLKTGGFIRGGGLAMLHSGERVQPADVVRNTTVRNRTGHSGGVNIQEIRIDIGDQSLDIRSLRPSDVRALAQALAPELGREVENIVSTN